MSVENPSVPLSQACAEMFDGDGGPTAAGVRVTRKRALGYSAVWRAVNLIAGDVGRLPVFVLKRDGAGKAPDKTHPAYRLLRRKPNPNMTAFTFRQTLQAHALTEGNGYAYVVREGSRPVELMLLDPDRTDPVKVGGELWYVTHVPTGKQNRFETVRLPATDVIHIKGLGYDGLTGYPVLKLLRDTLGKAIAARDYGSRYFKNSARPDAVIEVPQSMKEAAVDNIRSSWERIHQGIGNAHKMGILREGAKLVQYNSNARDAQLIENLEFDAREVANVFGVPAHKVGDPTKVAYNSLESENQSYHDDTLDRWLICHEEEYADKLLSEEEKANDSHSIEFARQELLRTNLTARGNYYSQAVMGGWLARDEVRGFENLNPIPGGKGGEFTLPVNVQPLASAAKPEPADEVNP